jgi:hypothetical protein
MTAETMQNLPRFVIASEAKQSIFPSEERMDCFVATLLAMTNVDGAASDMEQRR